MNLSLNLIIVLVFVLAFGVAPAWTWLLFPVAIAFLLVFAAGVGMALSVLYVRFRDIAIIWAVLAQVLLYLTPILYPINAFEKENQTYEHLLMFNPLSVIFTQIRIWVLHEADAPTVLHAAGGWLGLLPATIIFFGAIAYGAWIFKREAPRIAEAL
jgi:ABC-2 type transport system permease protein